MAKNKPQIRFQGHEGEWKEKTLKQVVNYSSTGVRACDVSDNGLYDLYDANEVIGKTSTFASDNPYISIIKDGSGVGRVRLLPGKTNCLGTMGVITPKDSNDVNFAFSHLQTKDFKKHIISGAIPHVYFRDYGEDELCIPQPIEQKKIGEFFRNLDELIEAKELELEKLRQIKLALLDGMFPSDEPDKLNRGGYNTLINNILQMDNQLYISTSELNVPVIRFRGFTEPWKKVSLSENATFSKGRGYSKADIKKTGTPILLYGSLYTNYNTSIEYVASYADKKDGSIFSTGNEVVVPASGETAEDIARASAIYAKGIILGGDLNIIYPNEDIDPTFLALDITYGRNHKLLVKKAQGISVVHLHNTDIQELDLVMPDKNEQKKIGDFFRGQDENIRSAQLQINKLRNIKQACMQKMFA